MLLNQVIFLQNSGGAGYMNLIMLGLLFVVIYFFMIRPQNKKAKEQREFVDNLEKGDFVITAGGIHGKINKINGNVVTIEVSKNTYLKVEKDVISKDMSQRLTGDDDTEDNS